MVMVVVAIMTGPLVDREEATTVERQLLANAEAEGEQDGRSGPKVGEGPSQDVTDLILIIHGIGQGVCTIFTEFVLDETNAFPS
jgi:hypothetical protein